MGFGIGDGCDGGCRKLGGFGLFMAGNSNHELAFGQTLVSNEDKEVAGRSESY